MEKWLTACLSSRTLAQYSTDRYAGGLYCRVRNGTGCYTAAMAVVPELCMFVSYITVLFEPKSVVFDMKHIIPYPTVRHKLLDRIIQSTLSMIQWSKRRFFDRIRTIIISLSVRGYAWPERRRLLTVHLRSMLSMMVRSIVSSRFLIRFICAS